ncbi:MAG: hypothetical protein A2Y57_00340 [Candidatus Woykebacteria bacterium RBG_13_40_7b]|uniref:Uncharacterized protein n=1 Tax=Candidatus Woykebacteria bacterium RBG_13_40_7b TaxID=1802594 RepID=A0A1G1WAE6_9BACT|nr:MAG: hypothetical protein A2Y57_00340 [Candidatus Woykebacteria bacterium RBG_13_40_7b]
MRKPFILLFFLLPVICYLLPNSAFADGFYGIPDPSHLGSLGELVSAFAGLLYPIAGFLAFIYLIYGGFKYLTARDDPKAVEGARGTITSAIIGLIIVLVSYIIIKVIGTILNINIFSFVKPAYADGGINILGNFGPAALGTLGELVSKLIAPIFGIAGVVFFFILLFGGLKLLTSGGDQKAVAGAKATITNGVIGLLIILLSYTIIKVILGLFPGFEIF